MSHAYSYIRFSTPEQAKGRSRLRQLEACEAYCKANNLSLVKDNDYKFLDMGKSAYTSEHLGEHGQLKRFIDLVKEGTIKRGSTLIIESLDRLSRQDVQPALLMILLMLASGIKVVTLTDERVYTSESGAEELILSIFILSRANEESSTKSKRVGEAWRKKKELAREENKPIGNAAPMWIDYKSKKYVLNEERVAIVRRVFDMAISGYGKAVIAKTLNTEGIPSFKGKTWATSSVDKILRNRAVLGEYQPHSISGSENGKRVPIGSPIANYFPQAIDETTFFQASAAIDQRRVAHSTKQTKNFQIYQGVALCGSCHSRMHIVDKGPPPKGGRYLHCYKAKKGVCSAKPVRLDHAELVLKEVLAKVDSLALVQDSSGKLNKDLSAVEGRLAELKAKLAKAVADYEKNESDSLATIMRKREADIRELENERKKLKKQLATEKIVSKEDFLAKLDLVKYEERAKANALLKRLGIQVYIRGNLYFVMQEGELIFGIDYRPDNGITLVPYNDEIQERYVAQDYDENGVLKGLVRVKFSPRKGEPIIRINEQNKDDWR